MSGSKYFDRIAVIVTAITLLVTILFMNGATLGIGVTATTMGYENKLFDQTKVHAVDIVMNDWDDMIDNATSEEYYAANVVIDGEAYKNVGIRTKGNTSLSTVAQLGSERYSFKIEFDHYDSSKSYYGLDKLSLNNLIQDATMMKDYLTYTMMNAFDVHSSLCSYVYITVNGKDWGLYLAVEGVEEAFLKRNYGADYGNLYKPDSMSFGGGRGNGGDFDINDFDFDFSDINQASFDESALDPSNLFGGGMPNMPSADGAEMPDGFDPSDIPEDFDPSTMFGGNDENGGGGFGGSMGMGADDVKLQYIDDALSSYSNIWNNAKTDITEADQTRLVESLKNLSEIVDIESVVDVEQVIRYFVVHNYVCNGDSYTGSMVHNYYLYEEDGKLAMIPWDYNLAYGTFTGNRASETVNTPIDTPVSGDVSDRPMVNWIFESEEYTQQYHQYFSSFLNSVDIVDIIDHAYDLIKDYVAKDPTAFYSYDEFELGVETIRQFCELRSESISMQLANNETTTDMNYVDASSITLSDMGSMGGGMGAGSKPDMSDNKSDFSRSMPKSFDAQTMPTAHQNGGNNMPGGIPTEMPDDFDPSNMQGGFDGNFPGQSSGDGNMDAPSDDTVSNGENGANRPSGGDAQMPGGDMQTPNGDMQMPGGDFSFDANENNAPASDMTAWIWIAVSIVVLAIGLIIAKIYRA